MALLGGLRRVEMGDPGGWSSVGLNAARLLVRRSRTDRLRRDLPPAVRLDPRGPALLGLVEQGGRQIAAHLPLLRELVARTGWQRAAPDFF